MRPENAFRREREKLGGESVPEMLTRHEYQSRALITNERKKKGLEILKGSFLRFSGERKREKLLRDGWRCNDLEDELESSWIRRNTITILRTTHTDDKPSFFSPFLWSPWSFFFSPPTQSHETLIHQARSGVKSIWTLPKEKKTTVQKWRGFTEKRKIFSNPSFLCLCFCKGRDSK